MSKSLDGVLIKRANQKEEFTHKQIIEFARCADPITGPEYFMEHYFHIQHPTRGKIKYSPYNYQVGLVSTYHQNRFSISLLPRQTGKTTTAAGYLLWYAMFIPDSTILVAAHKYSGAQEIMARIRYAYETCPNYIRAGVVSYNKGTLEFENGSRIISSATTENTGRGLSISLLYLDEFAFVRNTIAKEFWTSISPTLSTGGKAIITSTPNSDDDQFWDIWTQANKTLDEYGNETGIGRNGFKAFRSYWHEHPDRDDAWAEVERGRIGEERFRREFGCEPIIFEETLINPIYLREMEGTEPIERQGQVRWYKRPKKGNTYVVSLDPSLGTGGDNAAIQVFELPSFHQVAEWQHNKTPIQTQVRIMRSITEYIFDVTGSENDIYYSVENNSIGEAALLAISEMGEENIRGTFMSEPKKMGRSRLYRKGFNTNKTTKIAVCSKFKQLIERGKIKIHSKAFISELKNFVATGDSFAAKPGETDDLVSSALIALRIVQGLQNYDPELDSHIRADEPFTMPMPFIMMT